MQRLVGRRRARRQPDRPVRATIPLDAAGGERLHAVSVVLGIDMKFETEFSMRLNGSLHRRASSPLPGKSWCSRPTWGCAGRPMRRSTSPAARRAPSPSGPSQPVNPTALPRAPFDPRSAFNDTATLKMQPPLWEPGVGDSFRC